MIEQMARGKDFYGKHMDDPLVTSLGGSIGAYFDLSNENRRIARELGGIHLLIQNIRNNFHGQSHGVEGPMMRIYNGNI